MRILVHLLAERRKRRAVDSKVLHKQGTACITQVLITCLFLLSGVVMIILFFLPTISKSFYTDRIESLPSSLAWDGLDALLHSELSLHVG